MNEIEEQQIQCPYCGESQTLLVDCSVSSQEYIEDCEICCRPMNINITISETGTITLDVKNENE